MIPNNSPESAGLEASKATPCPLCSHDHYCYLVQDMRGDIIKAICQWTTEPPDGWSRTNTAKDGRGVFSKNGQRQKRRNFPDYVQFTLQPKDDIPQWTPTRKPLETLAQGDVVLLKPGVAGNPNTLYEVQRLEYGKRQSQGQLIVTLTTVGSITGSTVQVPESDILAIATHDPNTGDREERIEYLYPHPDGSPLGRVVRLQWTDRRRWYEQRRKSKQIRPWCWIGKPDNGFWSDRGKGETPWPLYREVEAKEEILRGGMVFVCAGEQAVETYRELGLVATTCQGGEANYRQFVERLKDAFGIAKAENLKPFLAIHPDNDITGENKFGEELLRACDFNKIPAVAIEPLTLWAEMPVGGDIHDLVHKSGMSTDQILAVLETAVDEAIDKQETEINARKQRSRWRAPEAWQGELGYWVETPDGNRAFKPKTDFDFQVEREMASDDGGGLLLQFKRTHDRSQKRVFIQSTDYTTANKFEDALKKSLGDSIICTLTNHEVKALIRVRLHEYHVTRRGKIYRLINRIGQQDDGTWVFKDYQFTKDGEPTEESKSLQVWNSKLTGEEATLPAPEIAPQDSQALKRLVDVMRRAFGSNLYPALLTLGYAAAGVHYQEILEREGAFPTLNLFGDPGSGKTTAAECALSLVGLHRDGMMCDVSLSAAYERLKLSGSLLHCLDDPTRTPELNAFLKGFYNGKARIVRGKDVSFNVQKPHSPMMVTSNHACGENDAATQSRLVRLFFAKVNDGDRAAFHELPAAQKTASGCLTQLIKLGYPAAEVHQLEQELVKHLPNAHIRIAKSLALTLCYAQKVAQIAEAPEDLQRYVLRTICTTVNDPNEAGDSLRDFLEKLFILQSQGKVGDWNMRWIERGKEVKTLAIYLPGVWVALDKEFHPAYNCKVIESLLAGQGIPKTRQRFHRSEDESKAYTRLLLTAPVDESGDLIAPNPPEQVTRFCFELPADLLQSCSEKNGSTRSTNDVEETETQSESLNPPLINSTFLDQRAINEINEAGETQVAEWLVDQRAINEAPFVDLKNEGRSTAETITQSSVEGDQTPFVDLVDRKNTQTLNAPEQPLLHLEAKQNFTKVRSEETLINGPPEVGDIVVVAATATWFRSGSDKLHYREVPKSKRDAAELSINLLGAPLLHELMEPSKVLSISRDGQRVKVRNQVSGRTSVFGAAGVHVLKRGEEVADGNG